MFFDVFPGLPRTLIGIAFLDLGFLYKSNKHRGARVSNIFYRDI